MTGQAWLLLAAVAVVYALACWAWPYRSCSRCGGSGKRRSRSGRTFGTCRRCDGAGRRRRLGRWVIDAMTGRG